MTAAPVSRSWSGQVNARWVALLRQLGAPPRHLLTQLVADALGIEDAGLDAHKLQALTDRLTTFAEHYRTIARPFDWTFTRNDLNQVLAKIADREPDLRLAA